MPDTIVVKIGGSTLGAYDTTLEDVVALQRRGLRPVVVHGGGALISEWLTLHGVPTRFERGLRVTDERTLEVVVAVLAGLVNKRLGGGGAGGRGAARGPRGGRGRRVTDERTRGGVVAVLAGLVNKRLGAALTAAGGRAVGLSGADGGLLKGRRFDEALCFVREDKA